MIAFAAVHLQLHSPGSECESPTAAAVPVEGAYSLTVAAAVQGAVHLLVAHVVAHLAKAQMARETGR